MVSIIILSSIISLTATLFLAASPLLMGLWVILIALFIALFMGGTTSSWVGLLMFIIYIGGLLVMFAYFVALTPNLTIEGMTMVSASGFTFLLLMLILSVDTPHLLKVLFSGLSSPMMNLLHDNLSLILLMALILFLALVAVVKVCSLNSSPLRPYN